MAEVIPFPGIAWPELWAIEDAAGSWTVHQFGRYRDSGAIIGHDLDRGEAERLVAAWQRRYGVHEVRWTGLAPEGGAV